MVDGTPNQQPTYASGTRSDGSKKKGKTARCPFCGHIHPLETVKAKGAAKEYADELIAVADSDAKDRRYFRVPRDEEQAAATSTMLKLTLDLDWPFPTIPDERIPAGNVHTVMASGYGYETFGELMNTRQTRSFVESIQVLREVHQELVAAGFSDDYSRTLASFGAATICRRLRLSTRGARLRPHGGPDGRSSNNQQVGRPLPERSKRQLSVRLLRGWAGHGAGTWESVSKTAVSAPIRWSQSGEAVPCLCGGLLRRLFHCGTRRSTW